MTSVVVVVVALLVGIGCGKSRSRDDRVVHAAAAVEQAFRDAGITLRKISAAGAEQPAMGETSACATRYVAEDAGVLLTVAICDDAEAAEGIGAQSADNVAVQYAGDDPAVRERVDRALDSLDG